VARYTEQVDRSMNLFIGMLGHDIRNPLGTIRLSTEVLEQSGQLTAKAAQPIVIAAKSIQSIVELIIDFSRGQSNDLMPVSVHTARLADIFEKVVDETRVRHTTQRSTCKAAAATRRANGTRVAWGNCCRTCGRTPSCTARETHR
jgi:signal transduction histidine kinase